MNKIKRSGTQLVKIFNKTGNQFKAILNLQPKTWGLIFILSIPIFALIFYFLPEGSINIQGNQANFSGRYFVSLYFSTVIITTLGFGDIYPISESAQLVVLIESIWGMVIIGLFLNSIAVLKSKIDLNEEKEKQESLKKELELTKLTRHFLLLNSELKEFIRITTIITTPMSQRTKSCFYNKDFKFQDMCDMYAFTGQFKDSLLEPAINVFYRCQKNLMERLEELLLNVNMVYWPDLEAEILKVLVNIKEYNVENYIVSQSTTYAGKEKMSVIMSKMIKEWDKEIEYQSHNTITPYMVLYNLIKKNMPLIFSIHSRLYKIVDDKYKDE